MKNYQIGIMDETKVEMLFEPEVSYGDQHLFYKEETYKIVGICMEIHRELGPGFLEVVYKDAMELEFKANNIPYKRELPCNVIYKGEVLRGPYFADFKVFDNIILEIKAQRGISYGSFQQTINYLSSSNLKLGILINFGEDSLKFKRVVK